MTVQKYLKLFTAAETELDNAIFKMPETDKMQFIKSTIQFFQQEKTENDINDFIQFLQEQRFL